MIFGGRLAVAGARDSDVLLSIINRAAEMQAGGAAAELGEEE
jgi:hypothetical protein